MLSFLKNIIDKNTEWKYGVLSGYLDEKGTLLDFGCGDLSLSLKIMSQHPRINLTGVDVVDFSPKPQGIRFVKYDGMTLPFDDRTFDTVIAFHVFHHCDSPEFAYSECLRVAKKRVIFVEPIFRLAIERYSMGCIDWLSNVWKSEKIPLTYQFHSDTEWIEIIGKKKCEQLRTEVLNNWLSFLPFGVASVYEIYK